jgi:cob(I)alamin adenosyltransferase
MNSSESNKSTQKWYTGIGDDGWTDLLGSSRVPKFSSQPEMLGTLDEVTSALGFARSLVRGQDVADAIMQVQRHLQQIMAEVAATSENREKYAFTQSTHVDWLGDLTCRFGDRIEPSRQFILPGNTPSGGALDLARAIVRRAERVALRLVSEGLIHNPWIARYLNRLSSLCYVLARVEDAISTSPTDRFQDG